MTALTDPVTTRSPGRRTLLAPGPTCAPPPAAPTAQGVRWVPLVIAGLLLAGLDSYTFVADGAKFGTLLLVGGGLGFTLFHSRFGFTSAWRQLVSVGNASGIRAHALLLGTASTVVALIMATGAGVFGATPTPSGGPLGVGLLIGAFLFGLGMQIGGSCASGTLFAVGAGQTTIVYTLGGFIVGSTLYMWQYRLVAGLPAYHPILLSTYAGGWAGSWAITIAALLVMVGVSRLVQKRRNPPPVDAVPTAHGLLRVIRGSWPTLIGSVVLGVGAGAVLLVSGGTWGITSAFSVWGSKFLGLFGAEPGQWSGWEVPAQAKLLHSSVLANVISVTDIGIMIGAALASAAAGAWIWHGRVPWRTAVGAVIGGILMGIGARLAGGCNIGAYLSGISQGSLSGWAWGALALGGTWAGLKLRPVFGLANPKPTDSVC
ncbi:MAG TPA: YeeE/YedE family protein [Trebonia sp.]|nr:YeeE/YedE family protein [Trebonia sp.]